MQDIETRLESVENDLKEILSLLKSAPEYNRIGIPQQVQELRKDVDTLIVKDTLQKQKMVIYSGIVSGAILTIIWIADKAIELLTPHK